MKKRLGFVWLLSLVLPGLSGCDDGALAEADLPPAEVSEVAEVDDASEIAPDMAELPDSVGDVVAADQSEADTAEQDSALDLEEVEVESWPAVAGLWGRKVTMAALSQVPVVGTVFVETIALQRMEIKESGGAWEIGLEICALRMESTSTLVQTLFPDAFIESLEKTTQPASFERRDDVAVLVAPRFIELRGVRLTDPENEPMPTDADDPRVFDQDGDGKPGMTVRITGLIDGEVYVIQRASSWWEVVVAEDAPARLDGLVDWDVEQVVLGADNSLLTLGGDSDKDPDASKSRHLLRRLEAGTSCEQMILDEAEIFAGW